MGIQGQIDNVDCQYTNINNDLILVFCHPPGDVPRQREETTKIIQSISKNSDFATYSEVHIAAHRGRVDWKNTGFGERLKAYADFDHWGDEGSGGRDSVYDAILDFIKNPNSDNFDRVVEAVKKKYELTYARRLSILKHKVMHMFSPVDNDLQMLWEESVMTGRGGFNPEKWREIVNIYKDVDWKTNFHEALRLIEETIVEIKKSLQEEKKQKAEEILDFVKNAQSVLSCETSNANSDKDENMVVLMTQAFCLLQKLKQDKMKEIYHDLESKNGLNPVHEWLVKLDEMLEGLI
jgi:hypothetical protein